MSTVTKKNGKFILEPDPALEAQLKSREDKTKLQQHLAETELKEILARILTRLESLETRG